MALKDKLLQGNAEVQEVPDNVDDPEYYPEETTKLKFEESPTDTFTLTLVEGTAPDPDKFPEDWHNTRYQYLAAGQGDDPVIGEHNYRDQERLYAKIHLIDEEFHVWFYIKESDGKVWCAARNQNNAAPKNGGWKFDPP